MNRTSKVTAVPEDNIVIVDGVVKIIDPLNAPESMHALHWDGNEGWVEWTDNRMPTMLTASDFTSTVAPFILAFENADKLAINRPVQEMPETNEETLEHFYKERKKRLADTDYIFLEDYPAIMPSLKEAVIKYRQELRDMTNNRNYPWLDGYDTIQWPVNPLMGA